MLGTLVLFRIIQVFYRQNSELNSFFEIMGSSGTTRLKLIVYLTCGFLSLNIMLLWATILKSWSNVRPHNQVLEKLAEGYPYIKYLHFSTLFVMGIYIQRIIIFVLHAQNLSLNNLSSAYHDEDESQQSHVFRSDSMDQLEFNASVRFSDKV